MMSNTAFISALTLWCVIGVSFQCMADSNAGQDSNVVVLDDIRFEVSRFLIDSANARAELLLTSLKDKPRELKLNVYGTQLVDNNRNAYYFSTIELGRVLMRFEDKQNYLHYLLQPDTAVKLTVTADNISADADAIQVMKIVFEDSTDEGKFLDVYLTAPAAAGR
ncbi:hypothetical protein ACFOET_13050 [Parapedobacter deserti]|uniref:Uncharacterized protein n=1 Tax=Parapedobacter deserti TaxID=1912957 RepID=A0ABV7JKF0_9SPHI